MANKKMGRPPAPRNMPLAGRIAYHSEPSPNGCRLWTASTVGGYGQISWQGRMLAAHRVAWEVAHGPVPDGLHVLHDCPSGDNPRCVNPDHLWLGTNEENTADRNAKHRQTKGADMNTAKLSDADILSIRADGRFQRVIAEDYGVDQTVISKIKRRKIWKHI